MNVKAAGDDVRFKVKEEYNAYRVTSTCHISLIRHANMIIPILDNSDIIMKIL